MLPQSYLPSSKDWEGAEVGETLAPLLASVNWYHDPAHKDLAKSDFQKALLAMSDVEKVREKEAKAHGSQHTGVIHQVLRIQLLDVLRWAQYSCGSIPVQFPKKSTNSNTSVSGYSKKKAPLSNLHNASIESWLETTRNMTQEFLTEAPGIGESLVTLEVKGDIVTSLLKEVKRSSVDREVSSVVINVCAAALGLHALLAVSC